jgi:hypothetical protein
MDVGVMQQNLFYQGLVLYILLAGLVGLVESIRAVSTTKNPAESEIIINVPLALKIMTTVYIWPISAWQELISGDLVKDRNNCVSTLTIRFKFLISYLLFIQIKFSWKIFKKYLSTAPVLFIINFHCWIHC